MMTTKYNQYPRIGEEVCRRIGRAHAQRVGLATRHNIRMSPGTLAEGTIHWFLTGKNYYAPPRHPNCGCSIVLTPKEDLKR